MTITIGRRAVSRLSGVDCDAPWLYMNQQLCWVTIMRHKVATYWLNFIAGNGSKSHGAAGFLSQDATAPSSSYSASPPV
jgi:hypothetical protein